MRAKHLSPSCDAVSYGNAVGNSRNDTLNMLVASRPEPAPCTVRVSCESLESVHNILSRGDDGSQPSSSIATLSIRDPVSFWDGRQELYFTKVIDTLKARRLTLHDAVLEARRKALKGKGRAIPTDPDERLESANGTVLIALRNLQISSCKIDLQGIRDVIEYTQNNALLSTLSLKVNGILVSRHVQYLRWFNLSVLPLSFTADR